MALDAATIWEVRTDGSDNNGGGFVSGSGVDRSRQAASHATLTTASLVNSTTTIIDVDSGDYTCTDADVGNILQITGGTATAGFYEITARSAQQWTLDRSAGTVGQTVVGKMGGALGSPGKLSDAMDVSGMFGYVKSGTYTLTTTTAGAAGPLVLTPNIRLDVEGYETTRGDLGVKPVMDVGAQTSFTVVTLDGSFSGAGLQVVRNLKVDGQLNSGVDGFTSVSTNTESAFELCGAIDCVNGFDGAAKLRCIRCIADNSSGFGFEVANAIGCLAKNGAGTGFQMASFSSSAGNCISRNNNIGFFISGYQSSGLVNCIAENNTSHGFDFVFDMSPASNCLATNNGGYGFETIDVDQFLINCAGFNNTSGNTKHTLSHFSFIDVTADPYVNVGGNDYRPNNDNPGGAQLRAAGIGVIGQTTNRDIGAVQHADPAGGGGTTIISRPRRVM